MKVSKQQGFCYVINPNFISNTFLINLIETRGIKIYIFGDNGGDYILVKLVNSVKLYIFFRYLLRNIITENELN